MQTLLVIGENVIGKVILLALLVFVKVDKSLPISVVESCKINKVRGNQ